MTIEPRTKNQEPVAPPLVGGEQAAKETFNFMELFFTREDRHKYLEKDWGKELGQQGFYLIESFEYSLGKSEFSIRFSSVEAPSSKCTLLFTKVTTFINIVHEPRIFEERFEFDGVEDYLDFLEIEKDGISEYFIHTDVRELWWRTNEPPKIERE